MNAQELHPSTVMCKTKSSLLGKSLMKVVRVKRQKDAVGRPYNKIG